MSSVLGAPFEGADLVLRGLPQESLEVILGAELMLFNEMRGNGPDSYQRIQPLGGLTGHPSNHIALRYLAEHDQLGDHASGICWFHNQWGVGSNASHRDATLDANKRTWLGPEQHSVEIHSHLCSSQRRFDIACVKMASPHPRPQPVSGTLWQVVK